jgi:hypothetical protein
MQDLSLAEVRAAPLMPSVELNRFAVDWRPHESM